MASHRRTLNRQSSSRCLLSCVFFFLGSSLHVNCYHGDILKHDESISGSGTLVSAGKQFELRFFTTTSINATGPQSFVGIFYHQRDLDSAVWVANRDNPLPRDVTGVFGIAKDGNLKVLDTFGKEYWSTTGLENSSSTNRTVKLMDSGNLVLSNDDNMETSLWESFKNPTDTFLPGMKMDDKLTLTSWKGKDDPGSGLCTFKLDQQGEGHYVIVSKKPFFYWKNEMPGPFSSSDQIIPYAIAYLLSNFSKSVIPDNKSDLLNNTAKVDRMKGTFSSPSLDFTRLVMNNNGQLQYLTWDESKRIWSLIWSKPEDECGIYNYCGNFGSCNINNRPLLCKCLPGFKPTNPVDYWGIRDFSGGCTRNSASTNFDKFLSLKMMKVSDADLPDLKVANEAECETKCLEISQCVAYSYQEAENSTQRGVDTVSDKICWIWNDRIANLQEEYPNQGRNLSVRVAKADKESTARTCEPCGTYTIPYPLSTGQDCGDPMYSIFDCDTSSGQVSFKAPGGAHLVVSIDPSTRQFVIQVEFQEYLDARNSRRIPWLNESMPFFWTSKWITDIGNSFDQFKGRADKVGVELSWKPPLMEPTCTSSTDCNDWPNSTCNATREGKLRCLCHPNFRWDGSNLTCTKEGDVPKSSEESSKEPSKEPSKDQPSSRKVPLTLIVALPLACVTALACIIIYMWIRKMAKRQEVIREKRKQALHALDSEKQVKDLIDSVGSIEEDGQGIEVPFFDLECILAATNNFSDTNRLGQGGYGPVYLGTFPGGHEIAVKRLSSVSRQGLQEFKNEVVLISKLQHRNLVRLQGYCINGDEKILLYEYMPNKSLDSFIFDKNLSMRLDWKIRFNIILGITRGLLYLHQDSRLRIIHRDLKTSNILLDEEMNPKISDFGLARMVGGKDTGDNTTRLAGTLGYMSPEYALHGIFSVKSDVYSFGILLLEIICGKKNTGFYQSEEAMSLVAYAWRLWEENRVLDSMDQSLRESCNVDQFLKCITIAFLCVQEDPSDRPTISNIITMLDSETATVPTPRQPAFVLRKDLSSTASSSSRAHTNTEWTSSLRETSI